MSLVMVGDLDAVCAATKKRGGKVALPTVTTGNGLRFAYLEGPSGNRFGVFKPSAS